MLAGDDAGGAGFSACGPPPMLEAVREMCAGRGVACELALESPMACGFGACYGCAVPRPDGGYARLCVDGPVLRSIAGSPLDTAPAAGPPARGGRGSERARQPGVMSASEREQGTRAVDFCGIELEHPVINASGTFDAIAARRVYGDA